MNVSNVHNTKYVDVGRRVIHIEATCQVQIACETTHVAWGKWIVLQAVNEWWSRSCQNQRNIVVL